jgi:hypothetical protein
MSVAFLSEWAAPYEWAAMYRGLDLQVVPGRPGEKRPLIDWVEFQNALVSAAPFDRWFGPQGDHRMQTAMGLLTGACSRAGLGDATSGLMLVDLDVKEGRDGVAWWLAFVAVHLNGIEPETWRARTPGGGLHIFFAAPPSWIAPTIKFPTLGVDVRGQGGYVVTAPSVRPDGKAYEWLDGFEPWACELAFAPVELCDVIDAMRSTVTPQGPREKTEAATVKDAFGHDVDGREEKLRNMVWAALVDLRRECPIPPPQDVQEAEIARLWTQYEATTRSRLPRDPGTSNADLLEREGRGLSSLRAKWAYALAKWDTAVAGAASVPKSEDDPAGPPPAPAPPPATWAAVDPMDSTLGDPDARRLSMALARPVPRRWVVDGWIPQGEVTLIASGPGLGKSLLALQLACSTAIGAPWLGLETRQGSSLFVTCEDDDNEIDRRFFDIKDGFGSPLSAPFHPAMVSSRRHKENRLTQRGQHGVIGLGPYYPDLVGVLAATQPDVLILDTLADFFTGNENDRSEVNWFVKAVLGGLIAASQNRLSVLVLGHTSRALGSEFSGSSAWEGAVRARLFLERPDQGGPTERTLSRSKANYAGGDDGSLPLMWEAGMFRALNETPGGHMVQLVQTVVHEVDYAHRAGHAYTSVKGDPNNLYRALVKRLTTPNQTPEQVREAMRRAISRNLIVKGSGQSGTWKKGATLWEA